MQKAFVIGWPIAHSRSPLIHGYWLKKYASSGQYEKRPVKPEELPKFIQLIREGIFAGCNVTVPHKEAALKLADKVDETARAIGAVNTLWEQDGKVHATNTDAHGFMANLEAAFPDWLSTAGVPTIVGAGGSARAVIHALRGKGLKRIRMTNRNRARAEELAAHFGAGMEVIDWTDRAAALQDCGLLVNCTTAGMSGQPQLDLPLDRLAKGSIVYDLVYVPLKTPLLAEAEARGMRTLGGLGMLLHQAGVGFEHWFGRKPEVTDELYRLVAADIEGH